VNAFSFLSSSSDLIGGRSGAEGDLFGQDGGRVGVRGRFALSRAAAFRAFAALRPE
jgi:hypothetical protein